MPPIHGLDEELEQFKKWYIGRLRAGGTSQRAIRKIIRQIQHEIAEEQAAIQRGFQKIVSYEDNSLLQAALRPVQIKHQALGEVMHQILDAAHKEHRLRTKLNERLVFSVARGTGWTLPNAGKLVTFFGFLLALSVCGVVALLLFRPTPSNPPRSNVVWYVNTTTLNLRAKPGDLSEENVIVKLPQNTKVELLSEPQSVGGSVWVKVRAGSYEGWVNQKRLAYVEVSNSNISSNANTRAAATAASDSMTSSESDDPNEASPNVNTERRPSSSNVVSSDIPPSPVPTSSAQDNSVARVTLDIDPTTNLLAAPSCPVIRTKTFRVGQQPGEHCGPEHHQSTPNDETIRKNVEELIINDEWLDKFILLASIEVENGDVTIHGRLPTEDLTKAAERKISTIRGVRKVTFVR